MKKQISPKFISISFGILVLLFAIGFYVFAWTEPSQAPPNGNVAAPINVGPIYQAKTGGLGVKSLTVNSDLNDKIILEGSQSSPHTIYLDNGKGVRFWDSTNGELMRITNTGDVSITGSLTSQGQPVCLKNGTNCPNSSGGYWKLSGSNLYPSSTSYNVGIGMTNPANKLHVNGNIGATGWIGAGCEGACNSNDGYAIMYASGEMRGSIFKDINNLGYYIDPASTSNLNALSLHNTLNMNNHKISNVSEIDPVFGIQGKKYVTYMPDSIGQKVEVVGQAQLQGDKITIDLAKQPQGSNLWFFWQIVDRDSIIPFVSPQSNALLYAYINGSKFVVKLRTGERNAKFSYRLIATRLDHAGDTNNLYRDQGVKNYIDINKLRQ